MGGSPLSVVPRGETKKNLDAAVSRVFRRSTPVSRRSRFFLVHGNGVRAKTGVAPPARARVASAESPDREKLLANSRSGGECAISRVEIAPTRARKRRVRGRDLSVEAERCREILASRGWIRARTVSAEARFASGERSGVILTVSLGGRAVQFASWSVVLPREVVPTRREMCRNAAGPGPKRSPDRSDSVKTGESRSISGESRRRAKPATRASAFSDSRLVERLPRDDSANRDSSFPSLPDFVARTKSR